MLAARVLCMAVFHPLPATATCSDVTTDRAKPWAVAVRRHVSRTPKDVSASDATAVFAAAPKRAERLAEWRFDGATSNKGVFLRGLTFELSGRRRQDARPGLAKMYRVPPDRAWWPAVGAPLERGVRHHWRRNSTSPSISTGIPNGSSARPTALRAWAPRSWPKTLTMRSVNPFITAG